MSFSAWIILRTGRQTWYNYFIPSTSVKTLHSTRYHVLKLVRLVESLKRVRSKAVVLLLLIYCFMCFHCLWEFCVLSLFLLCVTLSVCVRSGFAIILKRRRKLVALLSLSCRCVVAIDVLLLFLAVPWVGLCCVVVVFPCHPHSPPGQMFNQTFCRTKYLTM